MKNTLLLPLLALTLVIASGCRPEDDKDFARRQQMLDAQAVSINSIEAEISRIRDGNGGDMSKWTPDTVTLYKGWQTELSNRYQEREKLIKQMNGDTFSESH